MKLVLIGLRGTGKSTVGRLLAQQLGWPFFDTDTIVQERSGMSIREIFEQKGEPHFRALEAGVVQDCTKNDPAVIASGGGAVLNGNSVEAMKAGGFVVHLTAEPAELYRRISLDNSSHATRPQLVKEAQSGIDELKKLMLARAAIYARARDVEVSVENRSPGEVAEAILQVMRGRGILPASDTKQS
ncbi:MAG TPA: shikimate kinase [Planctomycetota bacterium]|nr:shikimate kinase [Planctomycetota bacterium]